jgi:hypothetical protein
MQNRSGGSQRPAAAQSKPTNLDRDVADCQQRTARAHAGDFSMRGTLLGLLFAAGFAGAAQAGDFVVVSSTDPAISRGQELDSGATIPLSAGKSVVVIDVAGKVVRLAGSPAGAMLPRRQLASVNTDRMDALKLLVAQPRVRRSGPPQVVCPPADSLSNLDEIVSATRTDGCLAAARQAFATYVERALGSPAGQGLS